jgi:hypothetical protein
MDETIKTVAADEGGEQPSTMKKRWILTINNPVFADSGYTEVNPSDTHLEVLENHYDLSVLQEDENKGFFDFKYIKFSKDGKDKIILRPFFKDLDSIEKYFKNLKEYGNLKYAIYQYEKGENGTPHIQGFIIYKNSKRFKNVKQDFPTAHIIAPNGSNIENRDYCTKKDTRIAEPVEIGEFSEMRSRNDIVQFLEMLKLGADNITLKNMFPVLYAQYAPDKIEKFRQDFLKDEYGQKFRDVKATFVYGNARFGKTTYIYDAYPMADICRVNNYYKGTFEGYNSQKVLVLDEFTGKVDITFMNNLLDKFPLELPARFANRTACFEEVYIISNLSLPELYKEQQTAMPEVYKAFTERIKDIIRFTALGVWHYELKDGKPVKPPKQLKLSDLKPIENDSDLPF